MPPDTGGYQRQLTLLAPHLRDRFHSISWLGAVRDPPLSEPEPIVGVDHLLRIPAHRFPRVLRGIADPLIVGLALSFLLFHRLGARRMRILLLSPTMLGAPVLVRWSRLLGSPVTARYPTAGDATDARGKRVGRAAGVTAVAPSPAQVNEQKLFPMRLLPNAVEPSPVSTKMPSSDRGTFVYVGRLVARKRVGMLVDAWGQVATELPGWKLVIVGDGGSERDSVEEELHRRVFSGELQRCHLVGRVDDARTYLEDADALVFPSDREGLPNSVLEAMAAGVPVLAHPARVLDWFCTPPPLLGWTGAPADLASAMIRSATDPEGRRAVGSAGRAFIERHHSPLDAATSLATLS